MLTVALHEFAHGLGFDSQDDPTTGASTNGEPDIWDSFLYDDSVGLHWIDMNDSQRLASVTGNALTWDGPAVKAAVPGKLDAALVLRVGSTEYTLAEASFGPLLGTTPLNGPLAVSAEQLRLHQSRAAGVAGGSHRGDRPRAFGRWCVHLRGKGSKRPGRWSRGGSLRQQHHRDQPPGAIAPAPDITIPAFGITQADGTSLKAAVGTPAGNAASLLRDPARGYAGADTSARALMYCADTFNSGSSVVHWDTSATPNLLMEPIINVDLQHDLDLTVPLLRDIGWFLVDVSISGTGPTPADRGRSGHLHLRGHQPRAFGGPGGVA